VVELTLAWITAAAAAPATTSGCPATTKLACSAR